MHPCKEYCQHFAYRKSMGADVFIPFLLLRYRSWVIALWSLRDAMDISFCALLVESIQFEAVCRGWPSGACAGNTLDRIKGVDENPV